MNSIFSIIGIPFKYVLDFFNSFTGSYAVAILIFTVLVNLLLSPLNVKQQKTTAKQAKLRPKLEELKKKYGDDRQKMAQAQQDLYTKENVSPMGGCLPMLIRMLILLGVYDAIRQVVASGSHVNFNLFGLDLSQTPHFSFNFQQDFSPIWIIPILSGVASLISMLISQYQQKKTNPMMASQGGSMTMMMLIMPIFSIWIAFSIQAAVGYYWIISNIVNTLIQVAVNHLYSVNKVIALDAAKEGMERRKYEAPRIK